MLPAAPLQPCAGAPSGRGHLFSGWVNLAPCNYSSNNVLLAVQAWGTPSAWRHVPRPPIRWVLSGRWVLSEPCQYIPCPLLPTTWSRVFFARNNINYNFRHFRKVSKEVSVPLPPFRMFQNVWLNGKHPIVYSRHFCSFLFFSFPKCFCCTYMIFVFTGVFYLFSWPSLTSDSTESKTPAALSPMIRSILRLWCHESSRTYSDRLFTEEQRYWFSSLLHDSVEEFFCRDNSERASEMFSVEQVEMDQTNVRGKWTFRK